MSELRLPIILGAVGFSVLALSVGWWWLVFGNVVSTGTIDYTQAIVCLAADTDLCRLAEALCTNTHFFDIRWYAPEISWAAVALLAVALIHGAQRTRAPQTK